MTRFKSLFLAFHKLLACLSSIFKLWCCLEALWVKWGSVGSRAVGGCSPTDLVTCFVSPFSLESWFTLASSLHLASGTVCCAGEVLVWFVLCALPPGEGSGKAGAETLAIHKVLQSLEYKWEQHYFCWASKTKVLAWGFRFMHYCITK